MDGERGTPGPRRRAALLRQCNLTLGTAQTAADAPLALPRSRCRAAGRKEDLIGKASQRRIGTAEGLFTLRRPRSARADTVAS